MEQSVIPLFPLNTVLFPGMLLPLHIFEPRYKEMLTYCIGEEIDFGVVLLKTGMAEAPFSGDIYEVGTTAHIRQVAPVAGERFNVITTGNRRFRIMEIYPDEHKFLTALVEYYPIAENTLEPASSIAGKLAPLMQRYLTLFKQVRGERFRFSELPTDPLTLAFLTGVILPVDNDIKQEILSIPDAEGILSREYELLQHETTILEMISQTRPIWATNADLPYYPN